MVEEKCSRCVSVKREYQLWNTSDETVIVEHVSGMWYSRNKAARDRRQIVRDKLRIIISAIQNSSGGTLLIHIPEHQPGDRFLGYFDELVITLFPNITEDGTMLVDIYNRSWLPDVGGVFCSHHDFVCLHLKPLGYVSTVEFNTKIRNDVESHEPSLRCLVGLLSKCETSYRAEPVIRGIDDLEHLHENRNIEHKVYFKSFPKTNLKEMAHYIWYKLRLRENITSMSKLTMGGSYFVGIAEKEATKDYQTKILVTEGVDLKGDPRELRDEIMELACTHLVVLTPEGHFSEIPDNLFVMAFHILQNGRYVIEVAIRHVAGIVFYDVNGPRAYVVEKDQVVRMPREEWQKRLSQFSRELIGNI